MSCWKGRLQQGWGVFGQARWKKDWVKVSSELAQDRRAWSASVRDVVNAIGDASSIRPGWLPTQVQVSMQVWSLFQNFATRIRKADLLWRARTRTLHNLERMNSQAWRNKKETGVLAQSSRKLIVCGYEATTDPVEWQSAETLNEPRRQPLNLLQTNFTVVHYYNNFVPLRNCVKLHEVVLFHQVHNRRQKSFSSSFVQF